MPNPDAIIIGAGLAGAEAAWQLAKRGKAVTLWEMRPKQMTSAHQTGLAAELICSNSLRAAALSNAVGLLKEEMRQLDSLIMQMADAHKIPAGGALAVDRQNFAQAVDAALSNHPLINVCRDEIKTIPPVAENQALIIASGPLTSPALSQSLQDFLGQDYLFFHDAIAPIVSLDSIDLNIAFYASRYDKGEAAYINCPLNQEQYLAFYQALISAEVAPLSEFETEKEFESCMPLETMARRGVDTIRYGPLKPVGIIDPKTGKEPYAVLQLRQDNAGASLYNLVGCQTRLKWPEQKRVFSLIPGLANLEIVRYGVMHRNTYINSPQVLAPNLALKHKANIWLAGQLTGVEGYVESAASGLIAGINASSYLQNQIAPSLPENTAIGSLMRYLVNPNHNFQPMHINFGIMPSLNQKIRNKQAKNLAIASRALAEIAVYINEVNKKGR